MPATPQYWIVKQEPADYSWETLVRDGTTAWTGVRNALARRHLQSMRRGDWVGFYHTGDQKQLVGVARVDRAAYPDPTATAGDWVSVDLRALHPLKHPVPLAVIRADPMFANLGLVRHTRLSVMPVEPAQFQRLLALAQTPDR